MLDQSTMRTRCLGGFSVMWVTKLLISQVKKKIFCPKTTKFGPKLAFLVDLGQTMQAFSVPCWWVSWWLWHAGCISQDTYLLYLICLSAHLFSVADKLDISKIVVVKQVDAEVHQVGGVVPPHQVEHLSGAHCLLCLYLKK